MMMLTRLAMVVGLLALVLQATARAQSLEVQKAGVVRITAQAEGLRRTGTGFIVRLEADAAFILTASHVVEGDSKPGVEFFTRRNSVIAAEVVRIEGGDPRGLALLVVRGKEKLPAGLRALPVASSTSLSGGEPVIVIGFPQGGGSWAVLRANVVSLEGRELTLDGSIGEGNSGGPVLLGERVIGMVTTVGGGGGFGRALPASLVRLVLEGWGVPLASAPVRDEPVAPMPGTPPPAVSAPPAPSGPPAASGKPAPSAPG
ncbi:MAG: trypsin-like peptidase domain-containing protein, partial [Burkholderiales bacterium]|nr:trypsin-like peptidase domain-containing protein [Burkholderiales bacterium]